MNLYLAFRNLACRRILLFKFRIKTGFHVNYLLDFFGEFFYKTIIKNSALLVGSLYPFLTYSLAPDLSLEDPPLTTTIFYLLSTTFDMIRVNVTAGDE